ncbi:universal stress protein [Mucilaginibacter sp. HMF5004]|uniref:universal stress protein n=1 Tax=Mucilaginibacter rivuli TaxID=2857527 RepID=UPI001C5CDB22|nr:universal stress protein [Mucilaginibacter rivuli]MBW4888247.1 universal stress protein [Mucilaginibacter rivuli]
MKFQRILIAIDDRKYSRHAAEYGFELAHTFKAEVALVHIVEPVVITQPNDPSMLGAFVPSMGTENMEIEKIQEDQSKKLLDETIATLGDGLEVTQFSELGSTADTIISCAVQFRANLIVIGTHKRSGFDRLLMGSVAERILHHSPIPVLIVPAEEDMA